jgi:hypothetical protein
MLKMPTLPATRLLRSLLTDCWVKCHCALAQGAVAQSSVGVQIFFKYQQPLRAIDHLHIFLGYGEARGGLGACLNPQEIGRRLEKATGLKCKLYLWNAVYGPEFSFPEGSIRIPWPGFGRREQAVEGEG